MVSLYPVIMCGGAGTRLWPASRPSRPKQFIALAGNRSLFQDTASRVQNLVSGSGRVVVIAGTAHREAIEAQLAEIGVVGQVLLEPEARDSAAAMAAAALWVRERDPDGLIVFVASDHYIPDGSGFCDAVKEAAAAAAEGRIVTLGVRPTEASSAYGYIKPQGVGLCAVASFHEKPEPELAQGLIASGHLWNSGNFIVAAQTLIEEMAEHAPAVLSAAASALSGASATAPVVLLGDSFGNAPKISIDYAVMEVTRRASVLPVDFVWTDLGAWDAVAASGEGAVGAHIFEDAERILARAPDGKLVAAIGVKDLAIIVEDDAVLVCDLARSQEVKRLVERLKTISPRHLDFQSPSPESLEAGTRRLGQWLRASALPLWATLGHGADGGFSEAISLEGRASGGTRRARVQTRQIYVYSQAGVLGWRGPWKSIVTTGLQRLRTSYLRPDGMTRALVGADWSVVDDTPMLYDQAFVLLALSAAREAGIDDADLESDAIKLREQILNDALPNGGIREAGDHPFQSNAHMHLFEACLAWEEMSDDPAWSELATSIAELAMERFIDREHGFLREFFNQDWEPAAGDAGTLIEPGHQFEWAWLLARYGASRSDARAEAAARTLHAVGLRGIGQRPEVALDAMNDDMTVRSYRARLWPQTEWVKSSLILAEHAGAGCRETYLEDAARALRALWLYLADNGVWRDKRFSDGNFLDEPAPASSFYHIMAAFRELSRTRLALGLGGGEEPALS